MAMVAVANQDIIGCAPDLEPEKEERVFKRETSLDDAATAVPSAHPTQDSLSSLSEASDSEESEAREASDAGKSPRLTFSYSRSLMLQVRLQLAVADDLDDAIEQANATRYGLAAAIFTQDDDAWRHFLMECRAGCVNRNCGTAGASGALPFGGLGLSGNHRPAGAFSVDYCAHPVASMIDPGREAAVPAGMLVEDAWFAG